MKLSKNFCLFLSLSFLFGSFCRLLKRRARGGGKSLIKSYTTGIETFYDHKDESTKTQYNLHIVLGFNNKDLLNSSDLYSLNEINAEETNIEDVQIDNNQFNRGLFNVDIKEETELAILEKDFLIPQYQGKLNELKRLKKTKQDILSKVLNILIYSI
jgi:hypothetical protein